MVLTDKQKEDLNKGILEYLEKQNYKEASLALQIETGLDYVPPDSNGIADVLEKKQRDIQDLRDKVRAFKTHLKEEEVLSKAVGLH